VEEQIALSNLHSAISQGKFHRKEREGRKETRYLVLGIWLQARGSVALARNVPVTGIPGSTEILLQAECLAFDSQIPECLFFLCALCVLCGYSFG